MPDRSQGTIVQMMHSAQQLAARIVRHPSYGPFVTSVGSVSALRLAGGGLLFVSQVLLAGWMGPEAFGLYSFAWAWVAILATVGTLGLGTTSVRYIAAYRAAGRDHKVRGLIRFGRTGTIISSCVITAAALVFVAVAPPSSYHGPLALAFLALPALMILTVESAYARGFGWIGFSVVGAQIGRPVFLIILGALATPFVPDGGAEAYVLTCGSAYLLAAGIQHLILRRRLSAALGSGPREYEPATWMGMAWAMVILNGSQSIRANTDLLIVGAMLEPADLGVYTAVVRTATLVAFLLSVASMVIQPTISSLHSQGRIVELREFTRRATATIFVLTCGVGVLAALFGKSVLSMFGGEFVAGYKSLLILAAGHVAVSLFGPITSLLVMTDRQYHAATVHVVSILLNILLDILLLPRFGIEGAALATAVSLLLATMALKLSARRLLVNGGS
jgi:O-antigen/teichoic acid export membrane protein